MFNKEANIDKKAKYGFKRELIGTERPNLFVNIKNIVKKTNITSVINTNHIPNNINNIKNHEMHNLDNVFSSPLHNSAMMIMQNNQSSVQHDGPRRVRATRSALRPAAHRWRRKSRRQTVPHSCCRTSCYFHGRLFPIRRAKASRRYLDGHRHLQTERRRSCRRAVRP